jgi:hypothetical protein
MFQVPRGETVFRSVFLSSPSFPCHSGNCVSIIFHLLVVKCLAERSPDRSIGTTTMFRMLYNYSRQKYLLDHVLQLTAMLISFRYRDSEAELPMNTRQLKPDSSIMLASSGSSSPSLKVSVHTTTDQFIDETLHKEGL